jgi:hypothetical protein
LYASEFLGRLAQKELFELSVASGGNKVKVVSFYKRIKANYVGSVRDWLIGYSFLVYRIENGLEQYDLSLKDSILIDAENLVSLPYVKQALHKRREVIAKLDNKKVIDAEFIGVNGDKFSLSSLKGKVYLIDTWFKGCGGCAQFYKRFEKEVYPKFKNNKNFAVLSLSMDTNNERWVSGIESNLYTNKGHVNVWTGNFMDHPFLKHYQLQGGARQLLVSADGTIIYKGLLAPSDILIEKITDALSKISPNL